MLRKYHMNDKSDQLDDKSNSSKNANIIMTVRINLLVRRVLQQRLFGMFQSDEKDVKKNLELFSQF